MHKPSSNCITSCNHATIIIRGLTLSSRKHSTKHHIMAMGKTVALLLFCLALIAGHGIGSITAQRPNFSADQLRGIFQNERPGWSVIVVRTAYKITGSFEKTAGVFRSPYDALLVKEGQAASFTLIGDGGSINWAFSCNTAHCVRNGKSISFH